MEEGDIAVHGHEVYPSDVPSLGTRTGSRRRRRRGELLPRQPGPQRGARSRPRSGGGLFVPGGLAAAVREVAEDVEHRGDRRGDRGGPGGRREDPPHRAARAELADRRCRRGRRSAPGAGSGRRRRRPRPGPGPSGSRRSRRRLGARSRPRGRSGRRGGRRGSRRRSGPRTRRAGPRAAGSAREASGWPAGRARSSGSSNSGKRLMPASSRSPTPWNSKRRTRSNSPARRRGAISSGSPSARLISTPGCEARKPAIACGIRVEPAVGNEAVRRWPPRPAEIAAISSSAASIWARMPARARPARRRPRSAARRRAGARSAACPTRPRASRSPARRPTASRRGRRPPRRRTRGPRPRGRR